MNFFFLSVKTGKLSGNQEGFPFIYIFFNFIKSQVVFMDINGPFTITSLSELLLISPFLRVQVIMDIKYQ